MGRALDCRVRAVLIAMITGLLLVATPCASYAVGEPRLQASPSRISPNGDGVQDRSRVSWISLTSATTAVRVWSRDGEIVLGPRRLGVLSPGWHAWSWDGRARDGTLVPSASYTVQVSFSSGPTTTVRTVTVVVDRKAPALRVNATPASFYPREDGYRDTTLATLSVNEATARSSIAVKSSDGSVVRRLYAGARAAGSFAMTWDGHTGAGELARAGSYRLSATVTDAAGNSSTSSAAVFLSWRRLQTVSGSATFAPRVTIVGSVVGICSLLGQEQDVRTGWSGSIGLYSDYEDCGTYDGAADLVVSTHSASISRPANFVAWVDVAVSGSGGLSPWQSSGTVTVALLDQGGDIATSVNRDLPADTWSVGPVAASESVSTWDVARWTVTVRGGTWYDVQSFSVNWRAVVLL